MEVEITESTLSDGSKVFGVKVTTKKWGGAVFDCRDEKTALEVHGIMEGLVRDHKIIDVDPIGSDSMDMVFMEKEW